MQQNKEDWFLSKDNNKCIGAEYEAKALKNHKYYVKVKSQHFLRKVREFFTDTKKLICIDLGCGTGETIEYFYDKFHHVFGCDNSSGMIEYAASKNLENVTFKHCQAESMPFEDNYADIVVMFGILHHIDSGDKVIGSFKEVYRVLKKGGMVAVYDFNPLNPVSRHIVRTCPIDEGVHLDGYKKSLFPTTFYPKELASILKNTGFVTVKIEYLIFFPKNLSIFMPFERFLAKIPIGGMFSLVGMK